MATHLVHNNSGQLIARQKVFSCNYFFFLAFINGIDDASKLFFLKEKKIKAILSNVFNVKIDSIPIDVALYLFQIAVSMKSDTI